MLQKRLLSSSPCSLGLIKSVLASLFNDKTMPKSHQFPVFPLERFAEKSAKIRRPKEITCFSYDEDSKLHMGQGSSLRYYYNPDMNADLNRGFETFVSKKDDADEHLDSLLLTLMDLEEKTGKNTMDGCIVTWRGMMTKIMTVPYMQRGFIEEHHAYKMESKANEPQDYNWKKMSFWGYKFETLSTLPAPWGECSREYIEGRKDQVVNNIAQYCSIVKTGFGDTNMILAGEVDAVWDSKPSTPSAHGINYVVLKTTKQIRNPNDEFQFQKKTQRFWAQSFLLGVPKLIIGYRDGKGILRDLEIIETQGIPSMVKKGSKNPPWDGNVVINFTSAVLAWIKEIMMNEQGVWRLRYVESGPAIDLYQLEETGTGDILSDAFLQFRQRKPNPQPVDNRGGDGQRRESDAPSAEGDRDVAQTKE